MINPTPSTSGGAVTYCSWWSNPNLCFALGPDTRDYPTHEHPALKRWQSEQLSLSHPSKIHDTEFDRTGQTVQLSTEHSLRTSTVRVCASRHKGRRKSRSAARLNFPYFSLLVDHFRHSDVYTGISKMGCLHGRQAPFALHLAPTPPGSGKRRSLPLSPHI